MSLLVLPAIMTGLAIKEGFGGYLGRFVCERLRVME